VSGKKNPASGFRNAESEQPEQARPQSDLQRLAAEQNKPEFFNRVIPLMNRLRSYIKRHLRVAYLTSHIRAPVPTSGDIVDSIVLEAYERYSQKPEELSLEQWLYRIANRQLEHYISKRTSGDKRYRSIETLSRSELSALEEMPITADAEGEPWLPEDLDDSEIPPREVKAPADRNDPEAEVERKEAVQQVFEALCHLPETERLVFDLVFIEGFSRESAAKILDLPVDEVPKILERAKKHVRDEIAQRSHTGADVRQRAS